ncbi:hypothetical protein ES703_46335 [subsurface metagenome]
MQYISQQRQIIRSFYTGIGKTAVIFPSTFLVAIGTGMLNLGIIFYMREVYHALPSLIGGLMACNILFYILGCLLIRPLFDRLPPRYLMIIATSCMAAFSLLIYLCHSIPLIFILYGFYGLAGAFFWPPAMGWLSRKIEGAELNRVMSRFNLSWSLGIVISPILAGFLSERSPELPILGVIILFICTSLLITGAALALPKIRNDSHSEKQSHLADKAADHSTFLRFPAWVGLFTSFVFVGVIVTIFPLYAQDSLETSKSMVGTLLSLRTLCMTIGFILLGRITIWHFKARYIILGQIFLLVLLLFFIRAHSVIFFAALMPLLGLATSFSYSNSLFHGVAGSTRRADRIAINESLLTGGFICGSSIGGMLYQHYSMGTVFLFCILCGAAGILAQIVLLIINKRTGLSPSN